MKNKKSTSLRNALFYVYTYIYSPDLLVRSQTLYPAELIAHLIYAVSFTAEIIIV